MSHRTGVLSWALCAALTSSFACGDDNSGSADAGDSGPGVVDSGTDKPRPPFMRPDAGMVFGMGAEGSQCTTVGDCAKALACVAYDPTVSICARGCANDADCGTERCLSYSGLAEDKHCVNTVREPFGLCGPVDTSICATGSCLTFSSGIGFCVDICALGSDADGGVAESVDAGPLPGGLVECAAGQICAEGIVEQRTGIEGICATRVKRGALCGLELGLLCETDDTCAPADVNDETVPWRCYQDCTTRGTTCDKGKCTDFRGQVAYCL